MPGKLDPVSQSFSADTSGYIAGLEKAITANIAFIDSIDDVIRKSKELGAALKSIPDVKRISVEVSGIDAAIGKVGALKSALDSLSDREVSVTVRHVGDAGTAAAAGGMGADPLVLRELRNSSDGISTLAATMSRVEDHLAAIRSGRGGGGGAGLGAAALAAAAGTAGGGGDASAAALALAAQAVQRAQAGEGSMAAATAAARIARNVALANNAASLAAARDLRVAGGAGGGGAGGGALDAAAGGGGGFMTAAQYADKMMPFIKRWAGIAHYAIMGVNEALATILPATMAAGAATLVGWQGVEQMMPRLQAINATAESLGGAYGITSGQYLGTGSAIQKYQNLATGGVYELGGAAINLMKGGQGTVGQVGLNTIAMIDRAVAQMQVNMAAKGTMGTLGGILGQGTGYLQQFGSIGANLGNIFLGLAPHLPGVGGDYLSLLQGITGVMSGGIGFANQHGMGNLLGLGLAGEAGWRVGTPMLGLLSKFIGGGPIAKLGGMLAEKAPLGSGLESLGFGISGAAGGAADFLGALTGPEVAAMAMMAYGGAQLAGYKDSAQKHVGMLQTGITQAGFSAALTPLAHAIVTTTGLADAVHGISPVGTPVVGGRRLPGGRVGAGIQAAQAIGDKNIFSAAATGFTQTAADLIDAGPQLVDALKKAGLKGVSMADAFQVAQNALLDTTHAFGKDGKLNPKALTMLSDYVSAIGPMTQSAGGFNAAVAAQQIMSSAPVKALSGVNQSLDQMTSIMTGGPAGMAALFGMLGGAPVKKGPTRAGIQLSAPPAFKAMASALTSFTTAGGAAAWNTFAGQNGLISTEQQNLDQLRTYMTLGALPLGGKTGAQGIAAFQLMQMLPMASKSPAALAMLMQQGAQMGIGGYYQGGAGNLKQNYQAEEQALAKMAGSAQQISRGMNNAVIASSNLPKTAAQFSQNVSADLQSKLAAAASQDVVKLKSTLGHAGSSALIGDLVSQFKTAGFQAGPALMAGINATLKQAGFSGAQIKAIDVKVKADTSQAQAQINGIHGKTVHVPTHADVAAAQAAINSIHGKTVTITVVENILAGNLSIPGAGPGGVPYTPAGVAANAPGVYTHRASGGLIPGYGGGDIVPAMLEPGEAVVPKHLTGAVAPFLAAHRVPGFAGGGFVGQAAYGPGSYWGMDSTMALWNPAWRDQILASMGGIGPPRVSGPPHGLHALMAAAGGSNPYSQWEHYAAQARAAGRSYLPYEQWKAQGGASSASGASGTGVTAAQLKQIAKEFNVTLGGEIAKEIKNSASAKNIATALVSKIATEMNYATGVANAAAYGQGYDPAGKGSGIFGNMQLNPSGLTAAQMHASPTGNIKDYNAYVAAYAADTVTPGQSVQDQMKSYLATEKSFGTDLGKLRRQHLNKAVLAQIIAAGPQQGDQIAQSILGGQGGVGAANKLWAQIQKASKGIGAQAAMGQYGGMVAPDLKSAAIVSNNVSISIAAQGNGTTLSLSTAQINQLVALIQQKLLQQAKRNKGTGIKPKGKSS